MTSDWLITTKRIQLITAIWNGWSLSDQKQQLIRKGTLISLRRQANCDLHRKGRRKRETPVAAESRERTDSNSGTNSPF